MSASHEARQGELDRVLDDQQLAPEVADELFAVVDAFDAQPALRRALTDPSTPDERRSEMAAALLGGKVSDPALAVVKAAVALRWNSPARMVAALERQGVRALFGAARQAGELDEIEDELFRFSRLVDADLALRAVISDRRAPLDGRQQVIADLLDGKAKPVTIALAQRAVKARKRTFDLTIADFLAVAAAIRERAIATVEVARQLTEDQHQRLRAALSRQVGRDITLHVVVDPNLLGGVRVTLGDEVIEGTVAGKLTEAKRQLN